MSTTSLQRQRPTYATHKEGLQNDGIDPRQNAWKERIRKGRAQKTWTNMRVASVGMRLLRAPLGLSTRRLLHPPPPWEPK